MQKFQRRLKVLNYGFWRSGGCFFCAEGIFRVGSHTGAIKGAKEFFPFRYRLSRLIGADSLLPVRAIDPL